MGDDNDGEIIMIEKKLCYLFLKKYIMNHLLKK